MCGRFTQSSSFAEIAAALGVAKMAVDESRPRYNVAPTQDVAAVRETSGERELRMPPSSAPGSDAALTGHEDTSRRGVARVAPGV